MTLRIFAACDEPDCKLGQEAVFERFGETFGELLDGFRSQGWLVVVEGVRVVRCFCPAHVPKPAERVERDART